MNSCFKYIIVINDGWTRTCIDICLDNQNNNEHKKSLECSINGLIIGENLSKGNSYSCVRM